MEFLKYLAIGIGILAVWSLLLWFSGYWSRSSMLGKILTAFVFIASALVLVVAFFIRPNLGTIEVLVEKGLIKKINKIELMADLKLQKYSQNNDYMIIDDEKGRHYQARLPKNITGMSEALSLHSSDSFLISFNYLIRKIKNLYIIVTWSKLIPFAMSLGAVFVVWAAGNEGQLAFLIPGGDD